MIAKLKRAAKQHQLLVIMVLFAILSLCYVFPLAATKTIYLGDDLPYHVNRIQELTANLRQGNWYPYLYSYHFHQVPFPLAIFYPQLTLLPFALFSLLSGNYVIGIYLGIALYTFVAMVVMYYVTRKLGQTRLAASLSALVYAYSACRTYNAYPRFALGEFLGMTFIILSLYGLYAIFKGQGGWKALAIGLGMTMLSHVLSTFLSIILLCAEFIVLALLKHDGWRKIWVRLVKAVLLFAGLTAIYVYPFVEQELAAKYSTPSPVDIGLSAISLGELWDNSISNNLTDGYLLNTNQGMGIGIILVLVIIWGIVNYRRLSRSKQGILVAGITLTLMATELFPWKYLKGTPVAVIQYPTRLLPFATALLALLSGPALLEMSQRLTAKWHWALSARLVLILFAILGPWLGSLGTYVEHMQTQRNYLATNSFHNGKEYVGNSTKNDNWYYYLDQYQPGAVKSSFKVIFHHQARIGGTRVTLKKITPIANGMVYRDTRLQNKRDVTLPVASYKNLQVFQNGKQLATSSVRGLIHVQQTGRGTIVVRYVPSIGDRVAMIVSLLTGLGLICEGALIGKRRLSR